MSAKPEAWEDVAAEYDHLEGEIRSPHDWVPGDAAWAAPTPWWAEILLWALMLLGCGGLIAAVAIGVRFLVRLLP